MQHNHPHQTFSQITFPLFILLLDLALLAWSIFQGYQKHSPLYYFKEGQLITFLSSFQLIAIALLCWIIYETEEPVKTPTSKGNPTTIWLLMSLGFLFLAFDEAMRIHENIDFSLHALLNIKETALTDRADDGLILIYAFIGLFLMYRYKNQLMHYFPLIRGYFVIGLFMLLLMVILDALTNRHDIITDRFWHTIFAILEESMKISAEFLFLVATYRCWKK